ncbi:hypothetical protein [Corynebacterium pacaense]|uniref:hypothetical protein n=1 Tax=Corynebacterium pacaense TaxID=1816684 RepID=UPI001FEADBA1|nr:hypothetical protein [Corynebacterium pacaense]
MTREGNADHTPVARTAVDVQGERPSAVDSGAHNPPLPPGFTTDNATNNAADTATDNATDNAQDGPDHWLDSVPTGVRSRRGVVATIIQETFGQPFFLARRMWSFVATSPGKITAMTMVISIAIFAAGYAMSLSSDGRQTQLDDLITNTEPVSYNAHVLYTSLSVADTTATTGFVQAGIESPVNRVRYNTAVDRAAVAATDTAASLNQEDGRIMELLTEIQRQLPVYTGLVETSRTNNRAGNPVGVAYMADASAMMRNEILPAAAELYNITSRKVSEQQLSVTRPQWIPLSGLLAALGMLIIAQWWLMRITRRRINRGFACATVMMLVATIWVSAANWATWQAGTQGFEQAAGPQNAMTTARIYAQQTRTTETLALVRRQSVQGSGTGFDATIIQINRAVDEYENTLHAQTPEHIALIAEVRDAAGAWQRQHEAFTEALSTGNYATAVSAVLETNAEGITDFDRLDSALSQLIIDSRAAMRTYIQSGLSATALVSYIVLMLSVASVVALWLGIRPRLQEYL